MKKQTRHLTPEQIEEAKQLLAEGWKYPRLGDRYGFQPETVKRAIDPEFQARRCKQVRDARRERAERSRAIQKTAPRASREPASAMKMKADGLARLAEIPPDRRNLTQKICGDPLFERSALFMRLNHG